MASRDYKSSRGMKVHSRDDSDRRDDRDRDRRKDRRRDDRDRDRRREREGEGHSKPVQGPIVLLKRPDLKSSSSTGGSGGVDRADFPALGASGGENLSSKSSTPTLILQRSSKRDHDHVEQQQSLTEKSKVTGPPPLTEVLKPPYRFPEGHAMKLIDSGMKICPWKTFDYDANNYAGNMDYFVITVIGRPNVGKSTILSYLAGNEKFGCRKIFTPRSHEEEMQSSIYITSDQIVFIEMSSVYNQAATNKLIPLVSQQGVLETSNMTWNLRLVRWALSVSHMILIVSENVFEPTLFQLMNSAEVIHTMDSALGEGSYPEPVYVCNKVDLELLDKTDEIKELQGHFSSVTGRNPRIETNYYVLPHMKYEMEYETFENFKENILEFSRYNRRPFAPDKEKIIHKNSIQEWYQHASRQWDDMNSPSYFSSYVKLLP